MKNKKLFVRVAASLLIAFLVVVIVFSGDIFINKCFGTKYSNFDSTDKKMFEALSSLCISENEASLSLSSPVLFVRKGTIRGGAYLFNFNITEYKATLGLNAGTFAREILLESNACSPSTYRLAWFAPGISSLLFSPKTTVVNICGQPVNVICYDEESLNNGTFAYEVSALITEN